MVRRVLIVGGGITGLTVAHECIEAGADVEIYEAEQRWGGKAVSYRLDAEEGIAGVPVEHSLRSFGSVYFSLFETMRRIPCEKGSTFDMLRPVLGIVLNGTDGFVARLSTALDRPAWRHGFDLYRAMRAFGVPRRDFAFWCSRVGRYIAGSRALRAAVAANRFDEHFQLARRSRAFADFMSAFVDIIFAAKPDANAASVIELFALVMLARRINPYGLSHRVNITRGPVNECFVDPWTAHLRGQGVSMHLGASAVAVVGMESAERIAAIRFADGSQRTADAYVLAVPPPAIAALIPEIYANSILPKMRQELSAGVQLVLRRIPKQLVDHDCFTLFLASPWAIITVLEAPPLWEGVPLPRGVAGVLSATISRFDTPGTVHRKSFRQCNEQEVFDEILAQVGISDRSAVIGIHAGPLLRLPTSAEGEARAPKAFDGPRRSDDRALSASPTLFIYSPESGIGGAPVTTPFPELFIAGEFTSTTMKIPTMEKASQAGKLCAATVLARLGLPYDRRRCDPPYRGLARRLLQI